MQIAAALAAVAGLRHGTTSRYVTTPAGKLTVTRTRTRDLTRPVARVRVTVSWRAGGLVDTRNSQTSILGSLQTPGNASRTNAETR
jgi:hypothetical protein